MELIQVEDISTDGTKVRSTRYRLTTLRPDQPRVIADEREALDAFDLEVIASSADPGVQKLIDAERR
ncbi:hypothetical protein [Brevundimonas sp. GCM10030266]|uniref:hypothetical protein n=1 Tax=Brevundimonas sp. GCM10030266 TaxID=3273386 RepID=UPI00361AF57D